MNIENFATSGSFQSRVQPWMLACFGPEISADRLERGDRFLEEALELVQSGNYPKDRVYALVEYVYGRDQGEINQEVGGVMVTLAAYCLAHDLDMHEAGETELARIWTKVEKIRAKQAAKPTGSALPIAASASAAEPVKVKFGDMPSYGRATGNDLLAAVHAAIYGRGEVKFDEINDDHPLWHQMVPTINFDSLNRIVTAFVNGSKVT